MHFLKHFTVWGLCAVMLGTQPALIHAAAPSGDTETYTASESSTTKQESKSDASKEDPKKEDQNDSSTSSSSEESDEETGSSEENNTTEQSSSEDKGDTEGSGNKDDTGSSETDKDTDEGKDTGSSEETDDTDSSDGAESDTATTEQNHSEKDTAAKEDTDRESTTTESSEASKETAEAASTTAASSESQKNTEHSKKDSTSSETADTESDASEEDSSSSQKAKQAVSEEKELKKLDDSIISEEESAEKDEDPEAVIPKIYGTSQITTRDDAEYMGDFVYFNQTDSIWNQNGYRISSAGCGPTSMAVVISSLTKKWVTPVDAAVWAYDHGYYSSAGSAHALIPAMAEAYGLKCEGVGTDYAAIKEALRKGNPVVALMGPGYFTRRGHFMVLIGIDENDHVTVADVGSRSRSAYKYALSDIISQSKSASAGGPFWVISKPKKKKVKKTVTYTSPQNEYVIHVKEDGQDKAITFHLGDQVSYHGAEGIILRFENRKAYITGADGQAMKSADGSDAIPLSDLQIVKQASGIVYTAIASRNAALR